MNEAVKNRELKEKIAQDYEWGFSSDIEQEFAPKGLSEETVRFISAKKHEPEWMLDWRLKAYRAWLEMEEAGLRKEGEGAQPASRTGAAQGMNFRMLFIKVPASTCLPADKFRSLHSMPEGPVRLYVHIMTN
jgi:hypothetical protein